MSNLLNEINDNFESFSLAWKTELTTVLTALDIQKSKYLAAYKRMVSLNAWRQDLLVNIVSSDSLEFFLEAQNDALVSLVIANLGSWRSALKSLRSCIENIYYCLYYKDHPIELELWALGEHKLGFSDMHRYLASHPRISTIPLPLTGLETLQNEYATLSRAVHGSGSFRMTSGTGETMLWSSDLARLGAWATRHSRVMCGVNLLLLTIFQNYLQGTKLPGLRMAAGLAIPATQYGSIKSALKIVIPTP